MSANFPKNREEAGLGSGPLQLGDKWTYKTIDYTYRQSPNNTGYWTSQASAGVSGDAGDISYKYYASTCSRTVQKRLEDRVSLADFCPTAGNATLALQTALEHATETGKTLYIPSGTYTIHDTILVQLDKNLSVVCEGDVVFDTPADGSFPVGVAGDPSRQGKLFDFVKDSGVGSSFNWEGGEIDGSNMPTQVAGTAPDLMTVRGTKIKDSTIKGVFFVVNRDPSTGTAGDSGLYLAQGETYLVSDCTFLGAVDAGLYISGTTSGVGKNCIVQNNLFSNCQEVAIISKREFTQHIITNNIVEGGRNGIVIGGEADSQYNPGKHAIISNNFCSRITYSSIEARASNSAIITDNVIEDFGFNVVNNVVQPVAQARAIAIRGSLGCTVSNNNIYMTDTYVNALSTLDDEGGTLDSKALGDKYVPGPNAVAGLVGYGILIQGVANAEPNPNDGSDYVPVFPSRFNNIYSNNIGRIPYAICEADVYSTYNTFAFNAIAYEQVRVRVSDTQIIEGEEVPLNEPSLTIDTHADAGQVLIGYNNRKTLTINSKTSTRREGINVDGSIIVQDTAVSQLLFENGTFEIFHGPRTDNDGNVISPVRSFIDLKDEAGEDRDCRIAQVVNDDETADLVLTAKNGEVKVQGLNEASTIITEDVLDTRVAELLSRIQKLESDHATMMGNNNGSTTY